MFDVITRWCCVFVFIAVFFISGCSPQVSQFYHVAKQILKGGSSEPTFNPAYHYLRVTIKKRVFYMLLWGTETTSEGVVKLWFSSGGEIIRMHNGRIVSTSGLPVDWRAVRVSNIPTWKSALIKPRCYQRDRDVMPGYRLGVHDIVTLKAIVPPKHSSLVNYNPNQLSWFEETSVTSPHDMRIPSVRFALDLSHQKAKVIYSEQCLSPKWCLALQPREPSVNNH